MSLPYEFDIQLPENYNESLLYPVLFLLHGIGSHERNMLPLTHAVRDHYIIISVRGDLPQGHGFAYYYIKGLGNPDREGFDRAVQQLQDFIEQVTAKYPVDPKRRYVIGFSQGAILAMTLSITMGEKLKGIVALNGYIPQFVKKEYLHAPQETVSVYISHGDRDPVFPLHHGEDNAAYFTQHQGNVTYRVYQAGHEITEEIQSSFLEWLNQDAMIISR
jgi:phospholipase/carboxylesterase